MVRHQTASGRHRQQGSERLRPTRARSAASAGGGSLNTGRINVDLKPRTERSLSVDQVIAELRPKLAQIPGMRAYMVEQPADQSRRHAGRREACTSSRCRTRTRRSCTAGRRYSKTRCEICRHRGRQQRPAAQEPADSGRDGSRQDLRARPERQPGGNGTLQRVRHASGVANLRAEQPVSGDPAGRARIPDRSRGAIACSTCDRNSGSADSARHGRQVKTDAGAHGGQPLRPAARRDDLVQPEAGRRARRRRGPDSADSRRQRCRRPSRRDSRAPRRRFRTRCRASA